VDEAETLVGNPETHPERAGDPSELSAGATVGRYVVLAQVGVGGMGVVYAAYDPELDRKVAVKILQNPSTEDKAAEMRARIVREAQAMAKVAHPNVAAVFDVGTVEDRVFIALEYIDGCTLTEWLERRPDPKAIMHAFAAAGRGLYAAHQAGIVHRDFKPDNVMIGADDRPRVMDFGVARSANEWKDAGSSTLRTLDPDDGSLDSMDLTRTGALLGTPRYMAPEQHLRKEADERSDQFSFCVALYEALYGQRPFQADNLASLVFQVTQGKVRDPPAGNSVPGHIKKLIFRGLDPKPANRFPDMAALLAELGREHGLTRKRLAFGGVLLAAGAALSLTFSAPEQKVCSGGAGRMGEVWGDGQRESVREAFERTGIVYAPDTFQRVSDRLDARAVEWAAAHQAACETHRREETSDTLFDRQGDCFAERLAEVEALIDVYQTADAGVLQRAVEAVVDLPPMGTCMDAEALMAAVPPPTDPSVAARVRQLDERLVDAGILDAAGRYEAALIVAREVLAEAEPLGYRPLIASTRGMIGGLEFELGQYESAEQTLKQAYWDAIASGDDTLAIAIATNLASVLGDEKGRIDEQFTWVGHARALIDRHGGTSPKEMLLHMAVGNGQFQRAEYEDARESYERALELARERFGPEHIEVAALLNNLGNAHDGLGEHRRAKELFQESLRMKEAAVGPGHPELGFGYHSLGNSAFRDADFEQAKQYFERAVEIRENALGVDHPEVAETLTSLAVTYEQLGRHEDGIEAQRRALGIFEAVHGLDHPMVGIALTNLGDMYGTQGDWETAHGHQTRALQMIESAYGSDHVYLSYPLTGIGRALVELNRPTEATPILERALRLKQAPGIQAFERGDTGFALARAIWDAGANRRRAVEVANQALVDLEGQVGYEETRDRVSAWLRSHHPEQ
jgi:tetratricopeptide (TPR) repeat protein/predicted Ser/Thr protein kinase